MPDDITSRIETRLNTTHRRQSIMISMMTLLIGAILVLGVELGVAITNQLTIIKSLNQERISTDCYLPPT